MSNNRQFHAVIATEIIKIDIKITGHESQRKYISCFFFQIGSERKDWDVLLFKSVSKDMLSNSS